MNKIDLIKFIETSMKNLQSTIEFSSKYNSPINFDSASFGETLTCILLETMGAGTNGGGQFDTIAGDEVKTMLKCQGKDCTSCKTKNTFFREKCHKCGKSDFKIPQDTRAGISVKEHFDYFPSLRDYVIVEISPKTLEATCREFTLNVYKIDKNNKFFNDMLKIQKDHGGNTKNLLTTSVEFGMSDPRLLFSCEINSSGQVVNDSFEKQGSIRVPRSLFKRQYREYRDLIDENGYDPRANPLNIAPRRGTHGKLRGKTQRTNLIK